MVTHVDVEGKLCFKMDVPFCKAMDQTCSTPGAEGHTMCQLQPMCDAHKTMASDLSVTATMCIEFKDSACDLLKHLCTADVLDAQTCTSVSEMCRMAPPVKPIPTHLAPGHTAPPVKPIPTHLAPGHTAPPVKPILSPSFIPVIPPPVKDKPNAFPVAASAY